MRLCHTKSISTHTCMLCAGRTASWLYVHVDIYIFIYLHIHTYVMCRMRADEERAAYEREIAAQREAQVQRERDVLVSCSFITRLLQLHHTSIAASSHVYCSFITRLYVAENFITRLQNGSNVPVSLAYLCVYARENSTNSPIKNMCYETDFCFLSSVCVHCTRFHLRMWKFCCLTMQGNNLN